MFLIVAVASADAIDDYVRSQMTADHLPGVSIAIVKEGKVVRAQGYGYSNLELQTPVKPETVFRIASMSKQFVSASIMLLKDAGKIDIDAPITNYLTEGPDSWRDVKVRHLMSHTSGIPNHTELKAFDFYRDYNEKQYLALMMPLALDSAPGAKYHYSNTNYSLLGLIVGRITKQPVGDFVHDRIFGPLHMDNSEFFKLENIVPNRASGYRWESGKYVNAWPTRPAAVDGSGAVLSTTLDLAKWDAALYTESPLTAAQKAILWTPNVLNDGSKTTYGFGWTIRSGSEGKTVSHSGLTPGFTSNIIRYLDKKITVIVLRNADPAGADKMAQQIASLYMTSH